MTGVEAALAAMDTAEQEAHDHLDGDDPQDVEYGEWAADRLRLIQRDKATLQRHEGYHSGYMDGGFWCRVDRDDPWPCPDARAVIDHWTQENA